VTVLGVLTNTTILTVLTNTTVVTVLGNVGVLTNTTNTTVLTNTTVVTVLGNVGVLTVLGNVGVVTVVTVGGGVTVVGDVGIGASGVLCRILWQTACFLGSLFFRHDCEAESGGTLQEREKDSPSKTRLRWTRLR